MVVRTVGVYSHRKGSEKQSGWTKAHPNGEFTSSSRAKRGDLPLKPIRTVGVYSHRNQHDNPSKRMDQDRPYGGGLMLGSKCGDLSLKPIRMLRFISYGGGSYGGGQAAGNEVSSIHSHRKESKSSQADKLIPCFAGTRAHSYAQV